MKTILSFTLLLLALTTKAQIDFSSQTNGNITTFSVTQMGQFYENITWYFGDGNTAFGSSVTHTYSTSGNFSVCVIGSPMPIAQQDTMCKFVNILATGINKNEADNLITIYPNPVKDQLNLTLSSGIENGNIIITDVHGHIVISQVISGSVSTIRLNELSNGLYFVKVANNSDSRVYKIIKQ